MKQVLIGLAVAAYSFGAISANSVWNVQSGATASNVNGCFFVTGASGTDRSQSNTPFATLTTLSVVSVTTTIITVSLTDYTVSATDVGNAFHEIGGTATDGWYQITAVDTGANTWTVDRAIGTAGQTVAGNMGGACNALTTAMLSPVITNNKVYVKCDGTYTTAANILLNGSKNNILIQSYMTTQGDVGCRSTIQATAGSFTIITLSDASMNGNTLDSFTLDCNNQTSSSALSGTSGTKMYRNIVSSTCRGTAVTVNSQSTCMYCTVTGQVTGISFQLSGGSAGANCIFCYVTSPTSGTSHAFSMQLSSVCNFCIGIGHASAASSDVFNSSASTIINSIAYNAGRDGIRFVCSSNCNPDIVYNTIIETAVGSCINAVTADLVGSMVDYNSVMCATDYTNISAGANDVAPSASVFVSAGTNFALNNTAGGGALLRGAGFPGDTGLGIGFMSMGPLQIQGGGGQRVYGGVQ